MKLYDLKAAYDEALEAAIDPETGEVRDADLDKLLDEIEGKLEEKALDIAAFVTELECEGEAIKARARELNARGNACENRAESLRRYLVENLAVGTKLKDDRVAIAVVPGKDRVIVDNPSALPLEYQRISIAADKNALAALLTEAGTRELLGGLVKIEQGPPSVRIR